MKTISVDLGTDDIAMLAIAHLSMLFQWSNYGEGQAACPPPPKSETAL